MSSAPTVSGCADHARVIRRPPDVVGARQRLRTARTGPGNDIKVLELASGQVRQLTFGEGYERSPSFSANGRHIAFMSTRSGKSQIFTISKDGKDLRQITKVGNNYHQIGRSSTPGGVCQEVCEWG